MKTIGIIIVSIFLLRVAALTNYIGGSINSGVSVVENATESSPPTTVLTLGMTGTQFGYSLIGFYD